MEVRFFQKVLQLGGRSPRVFSYDEKHGNDIPDPVDSMSMPTALSSPAPPYASLTSPTQSLPKLQVTSSGQPNQANKEETQEETLKLQPAASASAQELHHSAPQSPATWTKLKGNDTVPVVPAAECVVSETKPDNQLAAAKTSPVSVDKVAPTRGTPPVAPLPEAVPSAATTVAAPNNACGTRKPCEKASLTSTHSGPGTSRASRPSAASLAVPKRRRTSGHTGDCVLMFLSNGACVVCVIGAVLVLLFILLRHTAHEYIQSTNANVEEYCHTKDCEQHAQLILSKVNMNEDPCEDLNAFACSYWEPQADSYNYGAALDAQAIHDWFANFKKSLDEGSAHLMAGTKALDTFRACMRHRITAEEAERGKRTLREFMSKLRIPWPDEPSADVDPLGVLIDLSFRWQLGMWFELQPLQRQPRSESPPQPNSPKDGATSKRSTENTSRYPLLMSVGRSVGYWSVHNSEIVRRRNYAKSWATFYEAFGAGRPNKSDAYVQQVVMVGRDVLEEFLGVVNNEDKEPARFELGDIGNHTPNLPARRWIEQLNANAVPVVASAAHNDAGNRRGYASSDTITVADTALLRAVNRLFGAHNSTMLLRHLSWSFIQVFGALADRRLLVAKYGDNMKASVRRHVFCATELENAYGPLVRSLYVFPHFTARMRFAIDDTFATVTKEAAHKVSALAWADSATRLAAITKLHNARTALWPPDSFLTNEGLNEMYANFTTNLTVGKSLFIDYWINAQRQLRGLSDEPSLGDVLSLPRNYVLPYFDYDYLQNRVLVSVAALHGALRMVQATPAVLYGGLGFSYARQLLRALYSGGLKIDAVGNIVPDTWASPRWMQVKRERAACMAPAYDGPFPEIPALEVSHAAFQHQLELKSGDAEQDNRHRRIMSTFTEQQVFFITACFTLCRLPRTIKSFGGDCNKAAMHFEPYAAAFKCKPGSKLNPLVKCPYFN
ncbi:endothelin-converting enzyme 1-like isoform X3 [Dermacentor albipictus]|uniref:endothelin-converting enzyme 1-like isoform X3 n=1 Tax=Dermacentor albipictus TaxID=60249 RepID=UPI0031FD6E06